MRSERSFRINQVIPFLKRLSHTWYEPIQQIAISGSPDFILGIRGKIVLLELKKDGGKLSKLQEYKLRDAALKGNLVLVSCPENWKMIQSILITLNKGENLNGEQTSFYNDALRGRIKL